jgi:hypothetical protein
MSYVAVGVAIVAAVAGGVSSYMQAQSAEDAAKFNQKVAEQNSQLAKQQGIAASQAQDRQARQKIGAMTAAMGASGLDIGSGSALDVLADSERTAKLDKLTVIWNSQAQAGGYQNSATLDGMQADSASTAKTFALINTGLSVASAGARGYGGGGNALPSSLSGGGGYSSNWGSGSVGSDLSWQR